MEEAVVVLNKVAFQKLMDATFEKYLGNGKIANKELEDDKLSLTKASKFADMSIPTFSKRVKEGVFKKHGTGRKIFFLKSEIISALKNS